jgi:hypothetical protein
VRWGIEEELLTPSQRRVFDELLGAGDARPPADDELAVSVRASLEERTADAVALRPEGARGLRLNKTALDALDCEGRYLDHLEARFEWTPPTVLGTLVHRGIELDHAGDRSVEVGEVVAQAWKDFAAKGESGSDYLAGLGGVEAHALRADASARIAEFRECFPPMRSHWPVRHEVRLTCPLHRGAVELIGKPDLVFGTVDAATRRLLLVDLKTGRRSRRDRADMRFYALLATLKYRSVPWRVATYYLDEADWDAEDVDEDSLEAAVRSVADRVAAAARLTWQRPPEHALRLIAGPSCRWCGRAPTCEARMEADAQRALRDIPA